MGFTTTSKDISLRYIPNSKDGLPITNLCANCKDGNGKWWYTEITLDWHIGVDTPTGRLLLDSLHITRHTSKLELTAGGAVLLCTMDSSYNHRLNALSLDLIFHNEDGKLVYQLPPKNVRARLCHLSVDDSAILKGFAFTRYGTLCPTSLDLNKHLTNENGLLKKKRDGNFSWTAKNVHLDDSWTFCLDLMDYHKRWNEGIQCWELMDRWVSINDDGSLVMEDPAGTWDLRGPFFRLLEDIPVIGYIVAGIDELEGDHDEAIRAAAECTYATIVMGAALVGGALLGPVGAAVASGVAGYAGMYAKAAIGQHISNPAMRNEVTAITIYRVLTAELFLIAGVGIGEMSSAFSELVADELMAEGFDQLVVDMGAMLGKKGLKSMTKYDMKQILNNLLDAIKHGKSEDDIKHMFDDYENDGVDVLNPPKPRQPRQPPPDDEDTDTETSGEGLIFTRDLPPVNDGQDDPFDLGKGHHGWDEGDGDDRSKWKHRRDYSDLLEHTIDLTESQKKIIRNQMNFLNGGPTKDVPSYIVTVNTDGFYLQNWLESSTSHELIFRLDMSKFLAGKDISNSIDDHTNINLYTDDGYTMNLHISFRPSKDILHISQWSNGSWHTVWWSQLSDVFFGMEKGKDGWLSVRALSNTGDYWFETFNLSDKNERVHGAFWSVFSSGSFTQHIKYLGPDGSALFGDSVEAYYVPKN